MPTTPHSAAGWRIEPPVSEPRASGAKPAATAAALPPDDPPGTFVGSCGFRVGPKAEFSVELPMANSSRFVLPTMTAPASLQPGHDRGVVRRHPALEDPRRAGGGHPVGAEVVLQRDGHAGERARVTPGRHRVVDRGGRGPGLVGGHQVEGVQVARRSRRSRRGTPRATDGRRPLAGADAGGELAGRQERRHQGASPRIGGTRKRPSSTCGAAASTSAVSTVALDDVGPQHVLQGVRVRGRRHVVEVERLDVGGVVEHRGELPGEGLELVVGQLEPGQAGDVRDLVGGDAASHRSIVGRPHHAPDPFLRRKWLPQRPGSYAETRVTNSTVRLDDEVLVVVLGGDVVAALEGDPLDRAGDALRR